jgi:hypothetical protein
MSPELERILDALWNADYGDPMGSANWRRKAEGLINEALHSAPPGTSRDEFMRAILLRYDTACRARRKPPTLPPKA